MTSDSSDVHPQLQVHIEHFGPEPAVLQRVGHDIMQNSVLERELHGTRNRMLSLELVEPDGAKQEQPVPPHSFRATFYDYTNNRVVLAEGQLN